MDVLEAIAKRLDYVHLASRDDPRRYASKGICRSSGHLCLPFQFQPSLYQHDSQGVSPAVASGQSDAISR